MDVVEAYSSIIEYFIFMYLITIIFKITRFIFSSIFRKQRDHDDRVKEENINNNVDRISGLPDDVICHILSFLPTLKSLVRTSALSKSWRFRWADVTTAAHYIEPPPPHPAAAVSTTTFHMAPPGATTDSEFESWIENIFAPRNVRKLVVYLNYHLHLPTRLFNSETLVDLSLDGCCLSTKFEIHFPALKKLHLMYVVYECEESLPHLLSRCPVLEELIVVRMYFYYNWIDEREGFTASCDVSSPTLTRVELDLDKVHLKLHTPALEYLRLRLRQSWVNMVGALDSLIEADVDLHEDDEFGKIIPNRSYYTIAVENIVAKLCHVKRLTLYTRKIEKLNLDVKFDNLTELNLSAGWQFVTSFLVNANNLRVLTILRMVDPLPNCWRSHIDKTACLKSHLERVYVFDFGWTRKEEFDMISYILRYAKVLKLMGILYTQLYELDSNLQILEAHNKLALVKRASKNCHLVFH